jgi:hypothetical protein
MTDDQEEILESLGLLSVGYDDLVWNKRYEELVVYKKEHGHTMVSRADLNHKELSDWVRISENFVQKEPPRQNAERSALVK